MPTLVDAITSPLELRELIDSTYAFVSERFLPDTAAREQHSELARLIDKLLALRERLVYADFGAAELAADRDTLEDVRWILAANHPMEPVLDAASREAWLSA